MAPAAMVIAPAETFVTVMMIWLPGFDVSSLLSSWIPALSNMVPGSSPAPEIWRMSPMSSRWTIKLGSGALHARKLPETSTKEE